MLRHFFCKTPIALRQLMKDKTRLGIAMAGIAFANILIFAQMGFEASLFNSSTAPHRSLNADLVLVNRHFEVYFPILLFLKFKLV